MWDSLGETIQREGNTRRPNPRLTHFFIRNSFIYLQVKRNSKLSESRVCLRPGAYHWRCSVCVFTQRAVCKPRYHLIGQGDLPATHSSS